MGFLTTVVITGHCASLTGSGAEKTQKPHLAGRLRAPEDVPLEGYRRFIDDFVERVAEMPPMLRWGPGTVELDPVVLHMQMDDQLMDRILRQLRALSKP